MKLFDANADDYVGYTDFKIKPRANPPDLFKQLNIQYDIKQFSFTNETDLEKSIETMTIIPNDHLVGFYITLRDSPKECLVCYCHWDNNKIEDLLHQMKRLANLRTFV